MFTRNPLVIAITAALAAPALAQTVPSSGEINKGETVQVTAKRLEEARTGLSPDTGSTIYRFERQDIEMLPLGESTPLNQLILRAPGVVQDSFGQLHVRGDHSNLQYRINGVVIPEPIAGFGQAFDTRFADSINILTGALPAQYGYRTAGIVDIHTKGTKFENGGSIGFLGGSHSHAEENAEVFGSKGNLSYYLTGSYLQNDLGIENPTPERNAIHDRTKQGKGFGYLSYIINDTSQVSFTFGRADNKFQIPNVPDQDPSFTLAGAPPIDSRNLDARQNERNNFEVLSYQAGTGRGFDYQVSLFHRLSNVHYMPDPAGDLVFNGIAADITRRNEAVGAQADLAWHLGASHIVRTGAFTSRERFGVDNTSAVFPADDDGNQTSDVPITIVDNTHLTGKLFGVYLQDEWKPSDLLTVNYGVRYDKVKSVVDENQVSPRVGLVYDVTPGIRVHAGYARYFTPPPTEKIDTTTVSRFLGTTNALPSDANTAVKSERSNYYDAGVAFKATPELTFGIDAYYRDIRHLQDEGQFGNALIFSAFNYEQGKIKGVELSTSYRAHGFNAYANVAFSKALGKGIETGQFNFDPDELDFIANNWVHLDHDQTVVGSAGVAYKWNETTVSVDGIYGSGLRRGFANSEHLPSYTQVNLAAVQTLSVFGTRDVALRLAVVNLFDRTYQLRDGSGIGVGAPQFGPRRALYAGITKRF